MTLRAREARRAAAAGRRRGTERSVTEEERFRAPVCGLLCEVSGDCQAVVGTLLDSEARGRLITMLRGKGEVLRAALCHLRSRVSSSERD